jgi:hypothetical protein
MTPAPRLETVLPWRLRIRGLVVVGRPLWERPTPSWFTPHGRGLKHESCARELRTWTATHVAREILALTKNDADPGC